jgi:hypothetical protein
MAVLVAGAHARPSAPQSAALVQLSVHRPHRQADEASHSSSLLQSCSQLVLLPAFGVPDGCEQPKSRQPSHSAHLAFIAAFRGPWCVLAKVKPDFLSGSVIDGVLTIVRFDTVPKLADVFAHPAQ